MEMLLSSALSHGTAGIYDGMALVSTTTGSHGGVCCCSLAKIIRNSVIARAGILFETQMTKEKKTLSVHLGQGHRRRCPKFAQETLGRNLLARLVVKYFNQSTTLGTNLVIPS